MNKIFKLKPFTAYWFYAFKITWVFSWWDGWCCPGGSPLDFDQGISVPLVSPWHCLAEWDALKQNVPEVFNRIQVRGTWVPVSGTSAFIIKKLPRHFGHIRPSIFLHQEESSAHCIINLCNRFEDFQHDTLQRSCSCWLIRGALCDSPRICLPFYHWFAAKLVMPNDVAGSIRCTAASPDSLMPVTCTQCEPALICEESAVPVTKLPVRVFSGKCLAICTALVCEHRSHRATLAFVPPSWSLILIVWSETRTRAAALAALLLSLFAQRSR